MQIVEAAKLVFARKGFAHARMDDIVAESGLSKGTLYWYFDSKKEIITAILDDFFDQELGWLRQLVESEEPSAKDLLTLAEQTASDFEKMSALLPLSFEFFAEAARTDSTRRKLGTYYEQYRAGLTAIIQRGIRRGEFVETDAEVFATAIIAQIEGLALLWFIDPESVDLRRQARSAMKWMLKGVSQ